MMAHSQQEDPGTVSADALWYVAPGSAEIRATALPPVGPGQCRVKTLFTALSRGTERLVASGRVPESEGQRMRAPFQEGDFPFPVKYGYSCVGKVIAGPDDLMGQVVFSLAPHQTLFDVPADSVVCVPETVPARRAVLGANMETALNALWDGNPSPGDHISVVGGGVLGLLSGYLAAQIPGTRVTLVDINPHRRAIAETLGMRFSLPEEAPEDQDLVLHASASEAGLATALGLAGFEATVLELSWYGTSAPTAPLGGSFHSKRLTLKASQVGQIPAQRRARWTYKRRLETALTLLSDPALDALLTPVLSFKDLPSSVHDVLNDGQSALAPLIEYPK